LRAFGARSISKHYDPHGLICAVIFDLPVGENSLKIRLPVNIEKAELVLKEQRKTPKNSIKQQANRTAWKLLYDWVDLQLAMITLNQAQPLEVFFACVYNEEKCQTLFEAHAETRFKSLLPAPR
jgi:hypothetical protein